MKWGNTLSKNVLQWSLMENRKAESFWWVTAPFKQILFSFPIVLGQYTITKTFCTHLLELQLPEQITFSMQIVAKTLWKELMHKCFLAELHDYGDRDATEWKKK